MRTKAIYDARYRALVSSITETRRRPGLSQAELGKRLQISRSTVQKLEAFEVNLDLVRYVDLCRILGLRAGRLLGRLEEPPDEDDPLYLAEPVLATLTVFGTRRRWGVRIHVRLLVRQREEMPINIGESHGFKSYPRYQFEASVLLENPMKPRLFICPVGFSIGFDAFWSILADPPINLPTSQATRTPSLGVRIVARDRQTCQPAILNRDCRPRRNIRQTPQTAHFGAGVSPSRPVKGFISSALSMNGVGLWLSLSFLPRLQQARPWPRRRCASQVDRVVAAPRC